MDMEENYYIKFINFFRSYGLYDEQMFNYIWSNSIFYNDLEIECEDFAGIYYILDKHSKLLKFNLIVPYINNEKTLFINIHEYMHAIYAYYYLGQKIKIDETSEAIALLFEKIYLDEFYSHSLNEYKNKLNTIRNNSCDKKYVLGLKIADELLLNYKKKLSFKDLNKKSKRLLKKYKYLK